MFLSVRGILFADSGLRRRKVDFHDLRLNIGDVLLILLMR